MSAQLFAKLIGQVSSIDLSETGNRWIARSSDADAEVLTNAKVEPLKLGRHLGSTRISHTDTEVIALVGLAPKANEVLEGLSQVESSPAIFQLTVLELGLAPTASESEIRDIIEGRSDLNDGYTGHNLEEIQDLFDEITYWTAEPDLTYTSDIRRVLGSSICRLGYETPLQQPAELLNRFDACFLNGDDHLPYALLLQGLLASFWQTQFVEVYRCIEQLFPAEKVLSLQKKFGSRRSLGQINSFLIETLNWRPHEDVALGSLMKAASKEIIEEFRVAFRINVDEDNVRSAVANKIYSIRNAIVHYRGNSKELLLDEQDCCDINKTMLNLADELYGRFGKAFFASKS